MLAQLTAELGEPGFVPVAFHDHVLCIVAEQRGAHTSEVLQHAIEPGDKVRRPFGADARSLTDLLILSHHMTQDRLTELMTEKYPPDIMMDIPRDACSTFDFHRGRELIALGRSAFSRALDAFEAAAVE